MARAYLPGHFQAFEAVPVDATHERTAARKRQRGIYGAVLSVELQVTV